MLGQDSLRIHAAGVRQQIDGQRDARGGNTVVRRRQAGRIGIEIIRAPLGYVHDLDRDRAFWTRRDTGRCVAVVEAVMAHVAFADYSALLVVLRHAVGAIPGAVLAADASVGAVQHYAGFLILGVRLHRATDQAGWL